MSEHRIYPNYDTENEDPVGSLRIDLEEDVLISSALVPVLARDEDGWERIRWVLIPRSRVPAQPPVGPGEIREAVKLDAKSLIDAEEVATMLNVDKSWVHRYARQGKIPCVQLGRFQRFRRASILAWLNEHEHPGGSISSSSS